MNVQAQEYGLQDKLFVRPESSLKEGGTFIGGVLCQAMRTSGNLVCFLREEPG